jgi:putative DNA primase/helicase
MPYCFLIEAPAVEIGFEEIPWPAHWGMNFNNNGNARPQMTHDDEEEPPPQKPEEAAETEPPMDDVELTPELKARIEKYLDKIDPAVSGQHGHDQTYRVANLLTWDFALSFDDAKAFMNAYSKRCVPPWTEKEITHKLTDARAATDHARPRGHLLAPMESPPLPERPCFKVHHDFWSDDEGRTRPPGVYHHVSEKIKDGGFELIDNWLCTPLDVLAITATREDGEYGYLVEFTSRNVRKKRLAIPARCFAGETAEVLSDLLANGLEVYRPKQKLIVDYIAAEKPEERYAAALSTGWHNDQTFVLPDEVIGSSTKVWYQGRDEQSPYGSAGKFESWKQEVAARAQGNPNLIVSLCAALAGPLLRTFNIPGVGLNFFGPSTTGKTSVLECAQSDWGGEKFKRSWESTAVGLQAIAMLHTDTLLVVDELGLADAKTLAPAIYALLNGTGKSRGNVHARARAALHWRVFVLSSGEVSAETHLASGGVMVRTGHTVRLLDIPAKGKYGVFDDLHDFADGAAFADALRASAVCHYGHAGPRFVRALIETEGRLNLPVLFKGLQGKFSGDNDAQRRAAQTFAVMALAGELARNFGVLPWKKDEATEACVTLFERWKAQAIEVEVASPANRSLSTLASFINRFGDSRFSDIHGEKEEVTYDEITAEKIIHKAPGRVVIDRAGYWEDIVDEAGAERRIYLFTTDGFKEAIKGHEVGQVIDALRAANAFTKTDPKQTAVVRWIPRKGSERLYHIDPAKLRK